MSKYANHPDQLWGQKAIARYMGMSVTRFRLVHLDAMLACAAIFRKQRNYNQSVFWGFKTRIERYMAEYQIANGHL